MVGAPSGAFRLHPLGDVADAAHHAVAVGQGDQPRLEEFDGSHRSGPRLAGPRLADPRLAGRRQGKVEADDRLPFVQPAERRGEHRGGGFGQHLLHPVRQEALGGDVEVAGAGGGEVEDGAVAQQFEADVGIGVGQRDELFVQPHHLLPGAAVGGGFGQDQPVPAGLRNQPQVHLQRQDQGGVDDRPHLHRPPRGGLLQRRGEAAGQADADGGGGRVAFQADQRAGGAVQPYGQAIGVEQPQRRGERVQPLQSRGFFQGHVQLVLLQPGPSQPGGRRIGLRGDGQGGGHGRQHGR